MLMLNKSIKEAVYCTNMFVNIIKRWLKIRCSVREDINLFYDNYLFIDNYSIYGVDACIYSPVKTTKVIF